MKRFFLLSITVALLASWYPAAGVRAQSTEWPTAATLERAAVLDAAAEVTGAAYPNANTVLVDNRVYVRYERDGSYENWDEEYLKILTEKGRRETQQRSLHFDVHYSRVEPLLIEIIKPDGRLVAVDIGQQSRTMTDPSQMGSNIYNPDDKVMIITIPGLEIGDVVHFRTYRHTFKARMADTFSDYTVFEYNEPIKRLSYEIDGPSDMPLRSIALKAPVADSVEHSLEERGGRIVQRWVARDVPRIYAEPEMPPFYTVVQRLLVSTIPDWQTVSRWYWNLSKPRLDATTPAMQAKVDELVAGAESDIEKVRRLFRFVSQDIRYMGITTEDEAPGYEPHDVCITFENRYGVCRDKAALLAAMLQMSGIKGYPVLIHAGPKKDPEVPQPYFNHAIVAAELSPGEYTLMDPTDENTRDLLPRYLCGKSYLVAKPEGEDLKTSPIVPAEENIMRISSTGALDSAGALAVESTMIFEGINDTVYRGFFARQKGEDLRRFFERQIRAGVPGASLGELRIEPANLRDTSLPLRVELSFKADDCLSGSGAAIILNPPWLGRSFGMANMLLHGTGLEERKYPLMTEMACGVREDFSIALADSALAPLQPSLARSFESGKTSFASRIDYADGELKGESSLLLKAVEYTPEEYLDLKEMLAARELAARSRPIFRSEAGLTATPDVRIIEQRVEIELLDENNWNERRVTRKQVLTYAGKKNSSELKLDYNPAWQSLELEYARVIKPDGSRSEIAPEEMNLMDAPWVAGAPRYPAGKRLVVSLPGVEVGAIIETAVLVEHRGKPFFSLLWSPNGFDPVERSLLKISAPEQIELDQFYAAQGGKPSLSSEKSDGTRKMEWLFEALPGLKDESDLPPWYAFNPTVFLSTGDWSAYAAEIGARLEQAAAQQPRAAELARNIVGDAQDGLEKARRVRDFVAENINPAGPPLSELPPSAITPADATIRSGYGNTSDRAVVLAAMLRAVGLEPEFVLASAHAPKLADLSGMLIDTPQRTLFDTVLVRLKLDGETIYLNDGDQYDALGATGFEDRIGLALDGEPFTIQPRAGYGGRSEIEYAIDVAADGDARLEYKRRYFGKAYGDFRKLYSEMPPEERRRRYQEMVSAVSESASAIGELRSDYEQHPGVESFSVAIDSYAVRDGQYLYLVLPRQPDALLPVRTKRRALPLYSDGQYPLATRYVINLPPETASELILPEEIEWSGPADIGRISFETKISRCEDGRVQLVLERSADLGPALVAPADYARLVAADERMKSPDAWTLMLKIAD